MTRIRVSERVVYEFMDIGSKIYKCELEGDVLHVIITDYLEDAPENVILELICSIISEDEFESLKLSRYVDSDEFLESKRPLFLERRKRMFSFTDEGVHLNLHDSVSRLLDKGLISENDLDRVYFTWSKLRSRRKMGEYNPLFKTICISSILDASDVPLECLDCVVYHEILHNRIGFTMLMPHHPLSFKEDQNLFPD